MQLEKVSSVHIMVFMAPLSVIALKNFIDTDKVLTSVSSVYA